MKGKGSRQTRKKCVKATAYPCKFACILKTKNCRNPLTGQAKTFVLWLKDRQERLEKVNKYRTQKGRSTFSLQKDNPHKLVLNADKPKTTTNKSTPPRNQQKLTDEQSGILDRLKDRKQRQTERANTRTIDTYKKTTSSQSIDDRQAEIDTKYASLNPSDRDVNNWITESLAVNSEKTNENLTRLGSLRVLARMANPWDFMKYAPFVKDKKSFLAAYDAIQKEKIKRGSYPFQFVGGIEKEYDRSVAAEKEQVVKVIDGIRSANPRRKQSSIDQLITLVFAANNIAIDPRRTNESIAKDHLIAKTKPTTNTTNNTAENAIRQINKSKDKKSLKKAFKDFAILHHPDKGGDTKLFQQVSALYQKKLKEMDFLLQK